jgi:transposase InsO family protein
VRTVRQECLNKLFLLNGAHLQRVLREYIAYYNARRPHQGLEQRSPVPGPPPARTGVVCCRPVLVVSSMTTPAPRSAVFYWMHVGDRG